MTSSAEQHKRTTDHIREEYGVEIRRLRDVLDRITEWLPLLPLSESPSEPVMMGKLP